MKNYITLLLFFIIGNIAFAQKEPILSYEWFEEKSKIISELQMKKTGLKEQGFDVVFLKDNFKIYYSNKQASYSLNYKKNDTQMLALIEDVDLSKAIGIAKVDDVVFVIFPENSLTLQVYSTDQNTTKINRLDFYTNSTEDRQKMFATLYEVISFLKIEKGLMKDNGDWEKHWQEFHKMNPYEFYQKYPQSVLAYEGKLLEDDYNRQVKFVNDFFSRYNIPDLTTTSISQINMNGVNNLKYSNKDKSYTLSLKEKIKQTGSFVSDIAFRYYESDGIMNIDYTVLMTKDNNLAKQKYNQIMNDFIENIDTEHMFNSSLHLKDKGKIGKNLQARNVGFVSVTILNHEYKKENWYELIISFAR